MGGRKSGLMALLVGVAAAAATAASAADMPVPGQAPIYKASSYEPAYYNWTGLYIGGTGGGDILEDTFNDTTSTGYLNAGTTSHVSYVGIMGGVVGGADYEFAPMLIGVQGSWLGTNLSGSTVIASLVAAESERSTTHGRWYVTATGRVGYANNDLLFYGKAGLAWAKQDYTQDVMFGAAPGLVVTSTQTIPSLRVGFTVGGGAEYELTEHVSAFIEYNFLDFGTQNYNFSTLSYPTTTGATATGLPVSVASYIHQVLVGINLRYN
jgi:outer membrane immunogenic protein